MIADKKYNENSAAVDVANEVSEGTRRVNRLAQFTSLVGEAGHLDVIAPKVFQFLTESKEPPTEKLRGVATDLSTVLSEFIEKLLK